MRATYLSRNLLEIESITCVVISAYGLRIAIDHDRTIAKSFKLIHTSHTASIEFN